MQKPEYVRTRRRLSPALTVLSAFVLAATAGNIVSAFMDRDFMEVCAWTAAALYQVLWLWEK